MHETSKCRQFRKARGDFDNFLKGEGIDIGSGDDPLVVEQGSVRAWDLAQGDAQLMTGVPDDTFDFVYSSHCLEHMRSVPESLKNWSRILKPGGFLYLVVPDYLLYEKLTWPSIYNSDHKQSFSHVITRDMVARQNHWHMQTDFEPVIRELGHTPIRLTIEDNSFNYNAGVFDQTTYFGLAQLCIVTQKSK